MYENIESEPDLRNDPDYQTWAEDRHKEAIAEQEAGYASLRQRALAHATAAAEQCLEEGDDDIDCLLKIDLHSHWERFERREEHALWGRTGSAAYINEMKTLYAARFMAVIAFAAYQDSDAGEVAS